MTRAFSLLLIALAASRLGAQSGAKETVAEFMGKKVTLSRPALDEFGIPLAPAQVCFEGQPEATCFKFPGANPPVGFAPELNPIDLRRAGPAVLFSATQYAGGSGGTIHLALLRVGKGREVDPGLFPNGMTLSMQSEHEFWNDRAVSDAPIFVTADYVWGFGECHSCDHRFTISTYVLKPPLREFSDDFTFQLEDQYLTARHYVGNVLTVEKPEILARLKRVKAEAERQSKQPR